MAGIEDSEKEKERKTKRGRKEWSHEDRSSITVPIFFSFLLKIVPLVVESITVLEVLPAAESDFELESRGRRPLNRGPVRRRVGQIDRFAQNLGTAHHRVR